MAEAGARFDRSAARGPAGAWLTLALLEVRRVASPPALVAVSALAALLATREWEPPAALLAAELLEPDPRTLAAQARAALLGAGLTLVALTWLAGLARAHARSAGVERALWSGVAAGPTRRAAARWLGRVGAAAVLCAPIAWAAEHAAGYAPARPLLATLDHPSLVLIGERHRTALALPPLADGELRIELGLIPGAGPASAARIALVRPASGEYVSLSTPRFSGRRAFDLALPPGSGPLRLELARDPADPGLWGASDSLRWIAERVPGRRATAVLVLEFLAAAALAAALWPSLRRGLDGPIAMASLGTLWLWAWLGGVHAAWLPAGLLPTLLDETGAALVPALAPRRLAAAAILAGLALALEGRLAHVRGEGLRS